MQGVSESFNVCDPKLFNRHCTSRGSRMLSEQENHTILLNGETKITFTTFIELGQIKSSQNTRDEIISIENRLYKVNHFRR